VDAYFSAEGLEPSDHIYGRSKTDVIGVRFKSDAEDGDRFAFQDPARLLDFLYKLRALLLVDLDDDAQECPFCGSPMKGGAPPKGAIAKLPPKATKKMALPPAAEVPPAGAKPSPAVSKPRVGWFQRIRASRPAGGGPSRACPASSSRRAWAAVRRAVGIT